jgi:hypothetical protein
VGETLAETRREVAAQRAEVERTADRLRERVRRALDVRAKLRENPVLFGGLAAGGVFLAVGGPMRLFRAARRSLAPTRPEQVYDALPRTLQAWVDTASSALGPRSAEARQTLADELQKWRHDPGSRREARKLAREVALGQPGPSRAAWRALEAGATLISAALARRAIERFLSGDRPLDAAAELSPAHRNANGEARRGPSASGEGYAGWSARGSEER